MSLRLRLTLLSTLVMALVFAAFGATTFFTVRYVLYETIDENLERQSVANLSYGLLRNTGDLSRLADPVSLSTVFFMVLNSDGRVISADRQIPTSDALFTRALEGETIKHIAMLTDGERVRLLIQPVKWGGQTLGVLVAATPLAMADNLLSNLSVILLVAAAILIPAAAGGSYLLTGRALRPVQKVTQKARQIELSQDLSQRIPEPEQNDEVGELVRTFNGMLSRLDATFEAQRRFIADSSHELRTPLTVIRSNLHLLQRVNSAQERRELFAVTETEVSRLNRMVSDLLYMAQMQAGHTAKPILRPVELDSLLLEVFARARAMASTKAQRVVLAHEDIATTQGDGDQLQHLLLNLVDNAVKYTPPGGTISLGLWNEGKWARLQVADTGPGLAPDETPHVFERFFRTQSARDTVRNGSGLGLAIVKSIAEAHGGRVEVVSEPGKGSTFRAYLPTQRESAPRMTQVLDMPDSDDLEKMYAVQTAGEEKK